MQNQMDIFLALSQPPRLDKLALRNGFAAHNKYFIFAVGGILLQGGKLGLQRGKILSHMADQTYQGPLVGQRMPDPQKLRTLQHLHHGCRTSCVQIVLQRPPRTLHRLAFNAHIRSRAARMGAPVVEHMGNMDEARGVRPRHITQKQIIIL